MEQLAHAISDYISRHEKESIARLQGDDPELRSVFYGPHAHLLDLVFQVFEAKGGIEVTLPSGEYSLVPVLLQVNNDFDTCEPPAIGASGRCNSNHFLTLRNSPVCKRYIFLTPPAVHESLSAITAADAFGLSPENNSGSADIQKWWNDDFIQHLVTQGLERLSWTSDAQKDGARELIKNAVIAADQANRHESTRTSSWNVLARLWSINKMVGHAGVNVSLAAGFPPYKDGNVDAKEQVLVLRAVAEQMESAGFSVGMDQFAEHADTEEERESLKSLLKHFERSCSVLTALSRSTPYYYAPFRDGTLLSPPRWWTILGMECWLRLINDDHNVNDQTVITMECEDPSIPARRGMVTVFEGPIRIHARLPEKSIGGETDIIIKREANRHPRFWKVSTTQIARIEDDAPPPHRKPIRYSAEATGYSKGSIRAISMLSFEPGIFVFARTAEKISFPKTLPKNRDKVKLESTLVVVGKGRHYIDIFTGPSVQVSILMAFGSDENGNVDDSRKVPISKISESLYGFEANVEGDCFYQFDIQPKDNETLLVRVYFESDDSEGDECESEFERLIRLNCRRDVGRGSTDVMVNRQFRCTDLQTWILSKEQSRKSFVPIVIAGDYAARWHVRDWGDADDTVFSQVKFVYDPRPAVAEFLPPEDFLEAREKLSERIRDEGDGLVEAAKLGEWASNDVQFVVLIEKYLRGYVQWLEEAPELAAWCDVVLVAGLSHNSSSLNQEPEAVLLNPMHPIRLVWQCLAQRALYKAQKSEPCPAASVLDPDMAPDSVCIPLRTTNGDTKYQPFFSVECNSDYWGVLWNANRLKELPRISHLPPFDKEFGLTIGGMSSGFSVAQVRRAMGDVSEMLVAKPTLNVMVSSDSGRTNACNEGLITWCKERYGAKSADEEVFRGMGYRQVQILDARKPEFRPEDTEVSNLAEDTNNAVKWYGGEAAGITPDLGIIAQLGISDPEETSCKTGSPLAQGGLIRQRIRNQLPVSGGAFLLESRMALPRRPSGDGLADTLASAIARIENLSGSRVGYTFAPNVPAIQSVLERADFVAVSSATVDPACFLGGWLKGSYLWDYELPSYSQRAGDSNGYYLLSRVKDLDREALRAILPKRSEGGDLTDDAVEQVILEVARRGIPTVRGLASGDAGASGDLGLFIAARVLQDEFSTRETIGSLVPVMTETDEASVVTLIIPVDPFRGYLDDLSRAIKKSSLQRPDLLVVSVQVSNSRVHCRLTPLEVKYRGKEVMSSASCMEALEQARSFSALLSELKKRADDPEKVLWQLAFQHLLTSIITYGFRVYSQQRVAREQSNSWNRNYSRVIEAILSDEWILDIDNQGRLLVVDGRSDSVYQDIDSDGLKDTVVLSHADAAEIIVGDPAKIYLAIKASLGNWRLLPQEGSGNIASTILQAIPPIQVESEAVISPNEQGNKNDLCTEQPSLVTGDSVSVADPLPAEASEQTTTSGATDQRIALVLNVGSTVDGFQTKDLQLNLSDTNLNQLNIGIVGDLGTGKTQLLKSLVYQTATGAQANRRIKPRFLIFDYKNDYTSPDFVAAVGAKVVSPYQIPLNLFDADDAHNNQNVWLDRFMFFADVLDKIYSGVGAVQRQNLKQAVKQAYEDSNKSGRQPTIVDVHEKYAKIVGNKPDSPFSIIDDMVDLKLFASNPKDIIPFDKFLDGVVVISLSELGQNDRIKNMVVAIMLNMFYEHMLKIPKRPFLGSEPQLRAVDSFLLVDEADNIMRYEFDVLRKVLLQGREFGVGVILASQYLRHFKAGATDYKEPLLSWFVHKVPNVTPQELGGLGLIGNVSQLADRIRSLAKHECLFKTFDTNGEIIRGLPFYQIATEKL